MKIAVISDTHDHRDNIVKAVNIMNKRKVDALIHCGDFIAPFVKKWFDNLNNNIKENFWGVFGNNDGEEIGLKNILGQICKIETTELKMVLDGKSIFTSHMPNQITIDELSSSGKYDIILSGHTHEVVNMKVNGVLIVNPGEACGYLNNKATFAIIDTGKLEAEIIEL